MRVELIDLSINFPAKNFNKLIINEKFCIKLKEDCYIDIMLYIIYTLGRNVISFFIESCNYALPISLSRILEPDKRVYHLKLNELPYDIESENVIPIPIIVGLLLVLEEQNVKALQLSLARDEQRRTLTDFLNKIYSIKDDLENLMNIMISLS